MLTLLQANALLPYVKNCLADLRALKKRLDSTIDQALGEGLVIEDMLARETPLNELEASYRRSFEMCADDIQNKLDELQDRDILIKDIEQGLVDFISEIKGEPVLLCWQWGEPEISHWHSMAEGFKNRQSLYQAETLSSLTSIH